jgi:hypothetical protein
LAKTCDFSIDCAGATREFGGDAREADSGLGAEKEAGGIENYWAKKMGRTVPPQVLRIYISNY